MRRRNWTMAVALPAALLAALPSGAAAQTQINGRAPFIHVYSRAGEVISNYVEPSIEVGEDAYVFAVAIDLNGQIQVLHPEYAGLSVRLRPHRELQLKNFFAGFGESGTTTYSRNGAYTTEYDAGYGGDDTRGVIIALASRAPFNFDGIYTGTDWNFSQIRNLIEGRTPSLAAQNLAGYIGAKGEPIGRDFMRFAGGRDSRYAYVPDGYVSQCELGYAYGVRGSISTAARQRMLNHVAYLQSKGQNVSVVGYDVCGTPIIAYGPAGPGSPRLPTGRIPHRFPRDTTVFPKTQGIPATGAFPLTRGAGTIPSGYPGATTSGERRTDPRVILREPRRGTQPQSAPGEPVYAAPMRAPRTPTPTEVPSARRYDPRVINEPAPRVINEPAQGSFGSSRGRAEAPAPQLRIIEAPAPVRREQPAQRAEPVHREAPPQRTQATPPPSKTAAPPPRAN